MVTCLPGPPELLLAEDLNMGTCRHCGLLHSLIDGEVPAHGPPIFENRGHHYHQSHIIHAGRVADATDPDVVHALARAAIEERT